MSFQDIMGKEFAAESGVTDVDNAVDMVGSGSGATSNSSDGKSGLSPKSKTKQIFHHHIHRHHHHAHSPHGHTLHQIQPKVRSKSFAHSSTSSPSPSPQALAGSQQQPTSSTPQAVAVPLQQPRQRRPSSFSSTSSPWFRRKSFLSTSMMSNDKSSIYELSSYSYDQRVPSFTMSLKESQGFIFNQDLFASQYQQSRVIVQDDNQGTILKDLRNERSLYDADNEDYGIETTDVFIESGESDNEDALVF